MSIPAGRFDGAKLRKLFDDLYAGPRYMPEPLPPARSVFVRNGDFATVVTLVVPREALEAEELRLAERERWLLGVRHRLGLICAGDDYLAVWRGWQREHNHPDYGDGPFWGALAALSPRRT